MMKTPPLSAYGLLLIATLLNGCRMQGYERAQQSTVHLSRLISDLHTAAEQANAAADALTSLRAGQELLLTTDYTLFRDRTRDYAEAIDDCHARLRRAEQQMQAYWRSIEDSHAAYTDDRLRELSVNRLEENKAAWASLETDIQRSLATAAEHHQQLSDISTYLGAHLTQQSLLDIADNANRAILATDPTRASLMEAADQAAAFSAHMDALRTQ